MSATPEERPILRRAWREPSARKRQTTKIQNANEREKNAWDFLLTIRSPENMVRRYRLGETLADIAQSYNNVNPPMLERYLTEMFGSKWRVGNLKRKPNTPGENQ